MKSEGKNVLNKIKAGDKFFTPIEELNNSNKKRVVITSRGKKDWSFYRFKIKQFYYERRT